MSPYIYNGCTNIVLNLANIDQLNLTFNGCTNVTINITGQLPEPAAELYPHHREMMEAVRKAASEGVVRSRATCAVSFGKSHLIPSILDNVVKDNNFKTVGVVLPWAILTDATVINNVETLKQKEGGENYRFLIYHSHELGDPLKPTGEHGHLVVKPTSEEEAVLTCQQWHAEGRIIVVMTMYKSAPKAFAALRAADIEIDYLICDEAHNISRDVENMLLFAKLADETLRREFLRIKGRIEAIRRLPKDEQTPLIRTEHRKLYQSAQAMLASEQLVPTDIPVRRFFFMTATPTSFEERNNRAMENPDIFGDEIYKCNFPRLANTGYAINPAVGETVIDTSTLAEELEGQEDHYLLAGAVKGLVQVQEYLGKDEPVKAILYADSVKDIEALTGRICRRLTDFTSPEEYAAYGDRIRRNHQRFLQTVAAMTGRDYTFIGSVGQPYMSVPERVQRFDEYNRLENVVFVNCKTLQEGVNFPDANASLVLRSADAISIIQMFGRIVRLGQEDRERIASGELIPSRENLSQYKKSKAILLIADRIENDAEGNQKSLMLRVLEQYKTGDFHESKGDENAWKNENSIRNSDNKLATTRNAMSNAMSDLNEDHLEATRVVVDSTEPSEVPIDELFS